VVTTDGWETAIDELAETLSARFALPSLRLRLGLQRGAVEVIRVLDEHEAHSIVDALVAIGVHARVGHAPLGPPPEPKSRVNATIAQPSSPQTIIAPDAAQRESRHVAQQAQRPLAADPLPRGPAPAPRARGGDAKGDVADRTMRAVRPPLDALITEDEGQNATMVAGPRVIASLDESIDLGPPEVRERVPAPDLSARIPVRGVPSTGAHAAVGQRDEPRPPRDVGWDVMFGPPAAAAGARVPAAARAEKRPPHENASPSGDAPSAPIAGWSAVLGTEIRPPVDPSGGAPTSTDTHGVPPPPRAGTEAAPLVETPSALMPFDDQGLLGGDADTSVGEMDASPPPGFRRLTPELVVPSEHRPHPVVAALLSMVAPGAGQIYNDEHARAVSFALGGPFVVPWVMSVIDAVRSAREARGSTRSPQLLHSLGFGVLYWVALAGVVAALYGVHQWTRPSNSASHQSGVAHAVTGPANTESTDTAEPDLSVIQDREAERTEINRLLIQAQLACERRRFEECRELAEMALDIDEVDPLARRLHVRAIAAQSEGDPSDPDVDAAHELRLPLPDRESSDANPSDEESTP